jgi:hypothetical protein
MIVRVKPFAPLRERRKAMNREYDGKIRWYLIEQAK